MPKYAEGHKLLLAIDDDPITLKMVQNILSPLGIKVFTARSGFEGLDLIREIPINVILTDVVMPGMSGLEFLRAVKNIDQEVPIIILSRFEDPEKLEEAWELGAFDYLEKPINESELINSTALAFAYGKSFKQRVHAPSIHFAQKMASTRSEVFDVTTLLKNLGGDKEECLGLIRDFEAQMNHWFDEMKLALEKKDFSRYLDSSHSLKGAAYNIYAMNLANILDRVEKGVRQQLWPNDTDILYIKNALIDLKNALKQYIEELS